MKRIKYKILSSEVNYGTEEKPDVKQFFIHKDMQYSEETLDAVKDEAYNGEYTIYDDGAEENTEPTAEKRIQELEEALDMLLNGVTE